MNQLILSMPLTWASNGVVMVSCFFEILGHSPFDITPQEEESHIEIACTCSTHCYNFPCLYRAYVILCRDVYITGKVICEKIVKPLKLLINLNWIRTSSKLVMTCWLFGVAFYFIGKHSTRAWRMERIDLVKLVRRILCSGTHYRYH